VIALRSISTHHRRRVEPVRPSSRFGWLDRRTAGLETSDLRRVDGNRLIGPGRGLVRRDQFDLALAWRLHRRRQRRLPHGRRHEECDYFPIAHPDSDNFDRERSSNGSGTTSRAGRRSKPNGGYDFGWLRSEDRHPDAAAPAVGGPSAAGVMARTIRVQSHAVCKRYGCPAKTRPVRGGGQSGRFQDQPEDAAGIL
jgi:hypothetical protein